MKLAKRVFLFIATNILILLTISVVLKLLGVDPYMRRVGMDYQTLAILCLVWGFTGSLISLLLSRVIAKMSMGVQLVDRNSPGEAGWLYERAAYLARQAGLAKTPEVGIYEGAELNAFATGPSESRSLVAVSTGLLQQMDRGSIEAVIGHEIAHIKNGDMVTMTLLQGIINAFVMFLARAIGFALSQQSRDRDSSPAHANYLVVMLLEMVLSLLGAMTVAWYSRRREFAADEGGAKLAGKQNMMRALEMLGRAYGMLPEEANAYSTLKISGRSGGLLSLLASHPPIEERLAHLRSYKAA